MSLGKKRNMLAQHAQGSVLAHFDDDDWCVGICVHAFGV